MGALPQTRMTVPEFFAWWEDQAPEDRFELVDGEVVAMGRDNVRHNEAKIRALLALREGIAAAELDCQAYIDGIGVSPDDRNFRLPDAVVNCGPVAADATILPNPVIVLEIVSPRSESRDVHEKLADYFAIDSIMHYLIVYPERRYVVHHARSDRSSPVQTTFARSGRIELAPPGMGVSVEVLVGEVAQ